MEGMMEEKYIYRDHLKKVQKWMLVIGVPVSVLFVIIGLVIEQYYLVGFWAFFLIYDLILYKSYNRFTKAEFILDHDKITLKVKNIIKQEIKYIDIIKIDSKSLRYIGGWMLIYGQTKKPLRLLITIKDIGLMIKRIKSEVDAIEQSHVYKEKKLNRFFKTAYFADQSWQRASYYMPKFFIIIVSQMVLAISLSIINENILISFIFILAMLIHLLAYIYVECFIYAKRIRKQSDQTNWEIVSYDKDLAINRLKKVLQLGVITTCIAVIIGLFL